MAWTVEVLALWGSVVVSEWAVWCACLRLRLRQASAIL